MIMGAFVSMAVYSSFDKHLLSTLLALESMVLVVFMCVVLVLSLGQGYISLFYLVVSVCEGALGLTLLVEMSRVHGNDYLNSFSLVY
uniref:NADH-ubiquinone oxidoreductase chain 4L n=1 Tax=Podura aquatica TaxID=50589 RepID=Q6DVF8_9HEXA|nr:NADH dehydrogenase subunit 4L [Podura aquatica]AAT69341.1 NADH dehydrogenase subunit 4L [Podura aquatica]